MNSIPVKSSLLVFILLSAFSSFAQTSFVKPEISVFYGYGFASRINSYGGYLRIKDAPVYGGAIAIPVPVKGIGFQVELSYQRQDTKIESYINNYYYPSGVGNDWNIALNYFQVGALYNLIKAEDQRAVPFIGINGGLLWAENQEAGYSDETKFAYGLKGGAKIRMNDKIGLRLQATLLSPIQYGGIYLGYGSGGASTGVSVSSSILQFSINGGLTYSISKK